MNAGMKVGVAVGMVAAVGMSACDGREAVAPTPPVTSALAPPLNTVPVASSETGDGGGGAMAPTSNASTFADDVAFLSKYGPVHVLEAKGTGGGARVALSAKYQGRVMTSAVEQNGTSFGWINRDFIAAGKTGTQFDNYGGEDRFWLGPEGGQFGLYFPPGKAFAFDTWQVPSAMQEGAWDMPEATPARAVFKKTMTVTNWSGTAFTIEIERTVRLVDVPAADGVRSVAFETVNKITNKGKDAWKRETGLPSIWILAMFAPSPDAHVIVPFESGPATKGTTIVNDAYFGKVASERLVVHEEKGFLVFTADGKERGKIGVGPARAKPMLGSYSARAKLLTVVQYDKAKSNAAYVNSMWEQQKAPYAGDVVNSYNDGSPGPGKPPLGGFYEIESSSPGAELAPGQSLVHTHRTFHMVGEAAGLEPLAKKMLGVSLADVTPAR
ncbi:MAG: hypothetical protein QOI41_5051 [Myxococcales bacterium]|nr:hypothetical protein [Myxococcales bacterium]